MSKKSKKGRGFRGPSSTELIMKNKEVERTLFLFSCSQIHYQKLFGCRESGMMIYITLQILLKSRERMFRKVGLASASNVLLRTNNISVFGKAPFLNNLARTLADTASDGGKKNVSNDQLEAIRAELLKDIKTSEMKLIDDRFKSELRLRDEIKTAEER